MTMKTYVKKLNKISPVHKDARLCEHEVPQIQVWREIVHGGEAVVDEEAAVGDPQGGEDHNHARKHLDDL